MRGLFIFAGLLAGGWLVIGPTGAAGQQKRLPPVPAQNPAQKPIPNPAQKPAQAPAQRAPLEPAKAPVDAAAPEVTEATEPDEWGNGEIEEASRLCRDVLTRLEAEVEHLPPIRNGRCGDPAPVRLISIGKSMPVRFKSRPTVSCRMLEPLKRWIDTGLQPAADEHLETRVSELSVMSSYACRTRYGRAGARISEHAFANALDVGGFALADGRTVSVLKHWGATQRDIAKAVAVAAAKIKPPAPSNAAIATERTDDARQPLQKPQQQALARAPQKPRSKHADRLVPLPQARDRIARVAPRLGPPAPPLPRNRPRPALEVRPAGETPIALPSQPAPIEAATDVETVLPPLPVRRPLRQAVDRRLTFDNRRKRPFTAPPAAFPVAPYRLGGPKPVEKSLVLFLKSVHASACRIFGTTLGPEANEAHRNHFHVDMYPRKRGGYCE